MDLGIRIDPGLKEPIYRQLHEAIARQIRDGHMPAGSQLPSVRELALELRINPNTVARAYRELETSGFVASQRGRGVFVNSLSITDTYDLPPEVNEALGRLIEATLDTETSLDIVLTELRRRTRIPSRTEEPQ